MFSMNENTEIRNLWRDGSNDWMDNSAFNTSYTLKIYFKTPLSNSRVATEGERREEMRREEKGREEKRGEGLTAL